MDWTSSDGLIFFGMVFAAVALMAHSFMTPVFGENRAARKRLQRRMRELRSEVNGIRDARRRTVPVGPVARLMRQLPGMGRLEEWTEQAGYKTPPHRLAGWGVALGLGIGLSVSAYLESALAGGLAAVAVLLLALGKLAADRSARIARFEEQLQEAIGVMVRALRAGHPFTEAIRLVSDDLAPPVGREFATVFADINYGGDVRRALLGMLARVPSVTVMAFVTAVLVQRETGGNLAEILDKIGEVTRARFRFHRKVKTLSAEARMSAWVLALVPFVLVIMLSVSNPEYLPRLTSDPLGRQLVAVAFVAGMVGIVWIRHIIRIKV